MTEALTRVALAVLLVGLSVAFANPWALAPRSIAVERFDRNGVLRGRAWPDVTASDEMIDRILARERTALAGSAAFFGRHATLAVLTGREALHAQAAPGRVARGFVPRLGDYYPPLWGILVAAQIAFVTWALPTVRLLDPAWAPWALLAVGISLLLTVAGLTLAAWLVRQPHLAHTVDDLRWNDHLRADAVSSLAMLGPTLPLALAAPARAEGPAGQALLGGAIGYAAVVLALITAGSALGRRRLRARLWPAARPVARPPALPTKEAPRAPR